MHSEDSLKASSALQLLDTTVPDHAPGFAVEFPELFCPAAARGAIERSATRQTKKHFAVELALTGSINSNSSFHLSICPYSTPDCPVAQRLVLCQKRLCQRASVDPHDQCGREYRAQLSKLDLECGASQTRIMAHSYIRFDFGTDEEKAQQARHKLDGWKQAFRLDKRLLYKLERPENEAGEAVSKPEVVEKPAPAAKSAGKKAASSAAKTKAKTSKPAPEKSTSSANGKVGLLVRLYFSSHEKLSEQRWLDRIPSEEPFKSASPKVVHQNDPEFESTSQQFETLA